MNCPVCGDPVEVRGRRWECGWCTAYGDLPAIPEDTVPGEIKLTLRLTLQPDTAECGTAELPAPRMSVSQAEELLWDWDVLQTPEKAVAAWFFAALEDDMFVKQVFGSAFVGELQRKLLTLCRTFGRTELAERCRNALLKNPHHPADCGKW